jgi:biopolymer transport protein ExbB/TolQ
MVKWPIYVAASVVFLLAVVLAYTAYRVRRETNRKREDVKWLLQQLERALADIQTNDVDKVLSGLQTLTYLNDPAARLKALPRLAELAQHPNHLIARQAKVTMEKLSNFAKW